MSSLCPHQAVVMQPLPLRQRIPSQQHTGQSHLLVLDHTEHSWTHRNDRRHCKYQPDSYTGLMSKVKYLCVSVSIQSKDQPK